jgi:hypothetical protein
MGILDNLLEDDLSTINDLPTYEVPPKGFYKLRVKAVEDKMITLKDGAQAPVIQIDYIALEALELSDPTEEAKFKPNMEFGESYFFHNDPEKTKSALKTTFAEVSVRFGCKTLKEMLEKLEGLEVFATVNQRKDKNDAEKVYAQIRNVTVA